MHGQDGECDETHLLVIESDGAYCQHALAFVFSIVATIAAYTISRAAYVVPEASAVLLQALGQCPFGSAPTNAISRSADSTEVRVKRRSLYLGAKKQKVKKEAGLRKLSLTRKGEARTQ